MMKKKQDRRATGAVNPQSKGKEKHALGNLKRISYNLRSELDVYVNEFVSHDGIKEIMFLIEECQECDEMDFIYVCGQMLASIFMYGVGIESI